MDKAPDAFRTISEVADDLDVPQHVLRFWETRFQQIRPMKRGGGRRYYRPDDVDLLRGIRHLLYGEGYTIRGVQRILKDHGAKFVQSVWKAGAPQPERPAGVDDEERDQPPTEAASHQDGVAAQAVETAGQDPDGQRELPADGDEAPAGPPETVTSQPVTPARTPDPVPLARPLAETPRRPLATPVVRPAADVVRPPAPDPQPASPPKPEPEPPQPEPAAAKPSEAPVPSLLVLPREEIRKLQAALYELSECQRLLRMALEDGN